VHVIVAHFGLVHASRVRQVERLGRYMARAVPGDVPVLVAGDFNDWGERLDGPMATIGLARAAVESAGQPGGRRATFPALAPFFALDRVYLRGLRCRSLQVPRGANWARLSDHLPLLAEVELG
jgi:endonuclease/exonuclease/phosphatase family metal-dependent hydrolase